MKQWWCKHSDKVYLTLAVVLIIVGIAEWMTY